jgi:putative chitinase
VRELTVLELREVFPHASERKLAPFVGPLKVTFDEFEINTGKRQAAFLAQVGHESGGFTYLRELASGSAYEGRADLGNTEPGDGVRFKGRGLMQITGRKNYGTVGDALNLDLLVRPELLEVPLHAVRSAGWFWVNGAGLNLSKRAIQYGVPVGCNLNLLADADDFKGITLAINGGLVGMDDRLKYHAKALEVLT